MNESIPSIIPQETLQYKVITFSVMLATIMQSLDATIANVALPSMQGTLAGTQDQMAWVLTSYIVAAAIAIPLMGWLAGYFGRKLVFLVSIAGFVFASILCGLATALPEMVFFRILQGICGAALVPLSQSTLFDINSKENYSAAMAWWGAGITMGPILGPALGGWLTENYNWRFVFYINVPIGLIAFLGLYFFLEESPSKKNRFDFFGFVTLSLGVAALQLMLDRGELKDWFYSKEIIFEAICFVIGFYLFFVHTLTTPSPFINPQLFRDQNFMTGSILIFVIGMVLFSSLALLPSLLQNLFHYPVISAGLLTAPRGIGTLLAMLLVGRIGGYLDARCLVGAGLLTTALSFWEMTQYSLYTSAWNLTVVGVIQGFGIGLSYVPLSTMSFSTLPVYLRNEGTAFFNLMRNMGSSIGISLMITLLTRNTQIIHQALGTHITPFSLASSWPYGPASFSLPAAPALASLNQMLTQQAMMVAYINDFKLLMWIALGVLPLLFLLRYAPAREQ